MYVVDQEEELKSCRAEQEPRMIFRHHYSLGHWDSIHQDCTNFQPDTKLIAC